ncbi:hypothetical protein C8R43DRAFT_885344 [Mycena crocata]|nr:hypothetical protein C8R43DRAFT_885344 [Mycena crocata]
MTSTPDTALIPPVPFDRHFHLLDVPLDCIREIFLYLGPEDLLRLVRLCKTIRPFLINKTSRGIWKQAFANFEGLLPVPACPPDLTEIQYTNLAFSEHCHVSCTKYSTLEADWDLRVRCCSVCQDAKYVFASSNVEHFSTVLSQRNTVRPQSAPHVGLRPLRRHPKVNRHPSSK